MYYSSTSGFNLVKFAISGAVAAGATIGTAIFYAGRDDKIRNNFEEKLPFTKPVLTSIYGDKTEKKDNEEDLESMLPMNRKPRGDEVNSEYLDSRLLGRDLFVLGNESCFELIESMD